MLYKIENKVEKCDWILISILFCISLLLRCYKLTEHSIWLDEYVIIGNAKYFDLKDFLSFLYINIPDYGVSPASAFILYFWVHWFPEIDWLWRLIPITFGILTIIFTYFLFKALKRREVAFWVCIIFCLSPFNIWFHQELKCYAFLQFLVILSFVSLWQYFSSENKSNGTYLFIGFFSNMLTPWFHMMYIVVPLFQIPILFLSFWYSSLRKKMLWTIMSGLSIIPWIVWYRIMSPFFLNVMDRGGDHTPLWNILVRLLGIDSVGISEELIPPWKTNTMVITNPFLKMTIDYISFFDYIIVGVFITAIIWFVVDVVWNIMKNQKENNKNNIFILLFFLIPTVFMFSVELKIKKPIFHPLYFFYVLPLLYFMVADAIFKIHFRWVRNSIIFVVIFIYLLQCFSFISFPNRTNYKEATKFIESHAGINDIILGQRVITFWDINKFYMKRNDLHFQSFYTLLGIYDETKRWLVEDGRDHIWVIIEPYTLKFVYNSDPIAKINECFHNKGFDVFWKIFPGHYNLYVGYISKTKGDNISDGDSCNNLINRYNYIIDYDNVMKELYFDDSEKKDEYTYIIYKYISHWPIASWINIFTISELIKDGHYDLAERLCDYLEKKHPKFGDIYLLKAIVCSKEEKFECEKENMNVFKNLVSSHEFVEKVIKIKKKYHGKNNKYYDMYINNISKKCFFLLNDAIIAY